MIVPTVILQGPSAFSPNVERSEAMNLEKSPKPLETSSMTDAITAQSMMHEAFPADRFGNAKAAIWEAARSLGLRSERRARAIWNGEARRIDAHEMRALEEARDAREAEQTRRQFLAVASRLEQSASPRDRAAAHRIRLNVAGLGALDGTVARETSF